MIRRLYASLLVALLLPGELVAQDTTLPPQEATEGAIAEQQDPWERLAERAEQLAASEDASLFTIQRLRIELVTYRDEFLAESSVNAGRLETVDAQIAALGPVPESGEEPQAVAERRAALEAQRAELVAPRLLAQEAYARANGIIAEFDARSLQDQADKIRERGPSPLTPTALFAALTAVSEMVQITVTETRAHMAARFGAGTLWTTLPRGLGLLIVGIVLLSIGRQTVTRWSAQLEGADGHFSTLRLFLLSLVQICVPILGLLLLTQGLQALDIFGLRGGTIVEAIPTAGAFVIFGWWLSRHIFPVGATAGYLGYGADTRAAGRRYGLALAWVLAIGTIIDAGLRGIEIEALTQSAIEWPFLAFASLLFWRLGRVIRTKPTEGDEETRSAGRMRGLIGSACTIVAIAAPVLAAFGYGAAGRALLIPSILTITLIGVILLLQRIVHELSRSADENPQQGAAALFPVLISFILYLISLPVFALIWGARVADLQEVWARFREGFTLGDTQISPTDFLTFALVFALGYMLTRFIQGTLRKSVMPRTRLDIGGQNAVVAGFGYVGIMLAAIIAITSAGIDLSNIAIVAGALSVGIGFGLQNIVSNFVSGIILLIERPVSEGDWIEVGGQMGYVRAISVRSTRIETFDRTDVIVPNADLVSGQVTNWTRGNLVGRVIVPVGVAYGTDVDKVTQILRSIAEAHPLVIMTPPPAVLFRGFGADSLDFEIRAILRDVNYVLQSQSEMNTEIAKQFADAGIEIPFAQRDIWLRNPEVLKETST